MLHLALLLTTAASWTLAQDEFFEKYTYAKTMSECFGESAYEEYLLRIANAQRDCGYSSYSSYGSSYTTRRPTQGGRFPNRVTTRRPIFTTTVTSRPLNVRPNRYAPFSTFPTSFQGKATDISRNRFSRNFVRRPMGKQALQRFQYSQNQLYDSEAIQMAIQEISDALRNFTCVLGQLQLIDQRLNIDFEMMIGNYYNSPIPNELRQDLISGIYYCRDLVTCMPEDKSPISYELQRLMAFTKCEKKTRLSACLRQDIRNNIHHFDVSALPDDGQRTTDIEKLLTVLIGQDSLDQMELY